MYCATCGARMQNAGNFCSACGTGAESRTTHQQGQRSARSTSPLVSLHPTFIPWLSVLSVLPLQIFMTLWGGFFFGGFATVALQSLNTDIPRWAPFVISGCVFFIGIPLLSFLFKQKTYAKTSYQFYPQRLDYYEDFFTTEEKSIGYDNITEVNLHKGVFQKLFGLGTIILSTPATGFARGRAASGIRIVDIPNPDRVYQQIKGLIKRL